jgi:catechol 2,3-dioxygenase
MHDNYAVPQEASIGHLHLKFADLQRALDFYYGLLVFEITQLYGNGAAFISAGGYHHHIGLNTWQTKNSTPPQSHHTGLYHIAILYPTRRDLAVIFKRLQ